MPNLLSYPSGIAARVTLAAVLVAGCSPESSPPPSAPGTVEAYMALPPGPCVRSLDSKEHPNLPGAKRCIRAETGRMALVDFTNMPLAESKILAQDVKTTLVNATGEIINPAIDVVPASSVAAETILKTGCRDAPYGLASVIADETMQPQLRPYDFVLGISDQPSCSENVGGISDSGRHADIYRGRIKPNALAVAAVTLTHEVLHGLREGHDGAVPEDNWLSLKPDTPIDIPTATQHATVDEYNSLGPSPMSDGQGRNVGIVPATARLNPVQRDALLWPYGITGTVDMSKMPHEVVVKEKGSRTLSCKQVQEGGFVTFSPSKPITLPVRKDANYPGQSHTFDKIALTPESYQAGKGQCSLLGSFVLYLVESGTNTTVALGANGVPVSRADWEFIVGAGKHVKVEVSNTAFTVNET